MGYQVYRNEVASARRDRGRGVMEVVVCRIDVSKRGVGKEERAGRRRTKASGGAVSR